MAITITPAAAAHVAEQMDALREESSASCSRFIKEMGECEFSALQTLDDGDRLALRVTVEKGRATFDFSGTALARDDNLNATEAIVTSAVWTLWLAVSSGVKVARSVWPAPGLRAAPSGGS